MELKTFIAQALESIVEGVTDAQDRAQRHGAHINPGGLTRPARDLEPNAIWDNRTNNFARTISFDVSVTVEEGAQAEAKIGVVAGLFGGSAGGAVQDKSVSMNRIQFTVPILFPTSSVEAQRE